MGGSRWLLGFIFNFASSVLLSLFTTTQRSCRDAALACHVSPPSWFSKTFPIFSVWKILKVIQLRDNNSSCMVTDKKL